MDYEFNSKEELYKRVLPALKIKVKQIKRLGNTNVTCLDVWNHLIEFNWKRGRNLMLSDIVNDILCIDGNKFLDNK